MAGIKETLKSLIPDSPKKALLGLTFLAFLNGFAGAGDVKKPEGVICKDGICMLSTETAKNNKKLEQRIVYTSNYEKNSCKNKEIYTSNLDGSAEKRLTFNESWDTHPAFSPDGKKIVFNSQRDGNWEVYIMNNDGTEQKNLTDSLSADMNPSFSPDGKKIIFNSTKEGKNQIFQMDINGKNLRQLTNSNGDALDPAFSPDGKKITYSLLKEKGVSLAIFDVAKNKEKILLNNINSASFLCYPNWSPDGKKIVFNKGFFNDESAKMQVCLYDLEKNTIDELTDGNFEDGQPSFTPDGKKILFYSHREGVAYDVYQMDTNGRNLKKITSGGKYKGYPSISSLTVFADSAAEDVLKKESKEAEIPEIVFQEIKDNKLDDILNSTGTIIVDAYTTWCNPCKMYSKNILGPASQKYKNIKFMKVDAEKNREVSKQYDINFYPTTLIFKDGKFVEKFIGNDGGKLKEMIKKYSPEK